MKKGYTLILLLLCGIHLISAESTTFTSANFSPTALEQALKTYDEIYFESGVFDANTSITINTANGYKSKVTLIGKEGSNKTILKGISFKIEGACDYTFKNMVMQDYTSTSVDGVISIRDGINLTLDNVTITNNKTTGNGAAISVIGTSATISNSSFTHNKVSGLGSAIYCGSSNVTNADILIENSLIASNEETGKGAIALDGTIGSKNIKLSIINSTIAFNSQDSQTTAAGVYAIGGANTTLAIDYSTIARNVPKSGDGVNGVCFGDNSGALKFSMDHTIVSINKTDVNNQNIKDINFSAANVTSIRYCLIGTGALASVTNKVETQTGIYNEELKLDENLQDKGGATKVLPILSGSIAIDESAYWEKTTYNPLDIYYIDGVPVGIVFYVDETGKNGMVISKDEYRGIFATDQTSLGWTTMTTREAAMTQIKSFNKLAQYEVFQWCVNMGEGWYLPTLNDYQRLYDVWSANQQAFNNQLTEIGGKAILPGSAPTNAYWTCIADSEKRGLQSYRFYDNDSDGTARNDTRNARAIFLFRDSGSSAQEWILDFEDNFNGSQPNSSSWDTYWSSEQGDLLSERSGTFSIEDGNLVINPKVKDGEIIFGNLSHKKNYTYGKVEFRVKDGENWHILAYEWLPSGIKFYFDGTLTWQTNEKSAISTVANRLDIRVRNAATIDPANTQPSKTYIDWVKIYKHKDHLF